MWTAKIILVGNQIFSLEMQDFLKYFVHSFNKQKPTRET